MTLNGVMAVTLRYCTEVGKPALQKTIFGGIYARVYCIFSVYIQCRRKESSRSLSHLLMSFLYHYLPSLKAIKSCSVASVPLLKGRNQLSQKDFGYYFLHSVFEAVFSYLSPLFAL